MLRRCPPTSSSSLNAHPVAHGTDGRRLAVCRGPAPAVVVAVDPDDRRDAGVYPGHGVFLADRSGALEPWVPLVAARKPLVRDLSVVVVDLSRLPAVETPFDGGVTVICDHKTAWCDCTGSR